MSKIEHNASWDDLIKKAEKQGRQLDSLIYWVKESLENKDDKITNGGLSKKCKEI